MTGETSGVPLRDEVLLDRLTAPIAFRDLTEMVESMMLSFPLERSPTAEYSGERALMANLGAHGLRVALEFQGHSEFNVVSSRGTSSFDMLRNPSEFVDQETPGVAEWALDFGDALLKESYKCLGKDAEQKLVEYRGATTADEQVAIITWLDERLHAMHEPTKYKHDGTPEEFLFYHPVRLSPKVVGMYPNINIPPTCLGYSIIATSFFYNAGAPTLHAGVMLTDNSTDMIEASEFSFDIAASITSALGYSTDLSDAFVKRGIGGYQALVDADNGYHAVALTRLINGLWAQVDPNFSATQVVDNEVFAERITTAYDQLNEFSEVAPLLELSVYTPFDSLVRRWRRDYSGKLEVSAESIEQLSLVLTDDDIESFPRRIYEVVMSMYEWAHKDDDMESDTGKDYKELKEEIFLRNPDGETDFISDTTPLGDLIYGLITKYVLYEEDVATFKQRCRDDKRFLMRRMSDVVTIILAIPSLEAGLLVEDNREGIPHIAYEVGRPAPRVAMTVLSDFATLMADDPLPPTFWHSTWPSLVAIGETAGAAKTPAQCRAMFRMADFSVEKTLYYIKNYDIILDAKTPTTPKE